MTNILAGKVKDASGSTRIRSDRRNQFSQMVQV